MHAPTNLGQTPTADPYPHSLPRNPQSPPHTHTHRRPTSAVPSPPQILIDILTDRGFKASHAAEVSHVPVHFDLKTGNIRSRKETKHRFSINWDTRSIRTTSETAVELDTRTAEAAKDSAKDVRISQSFIPSASARRPAAAAVPAVSAAEKSRLAPHRSAAGTSAAERVSRGAG
eukprot:353700-Chlamydomonas_euryale.AAC.2